MNIFFQQRLRRRLQRTAVPMRSEYFDHLRRTVVGEEKKHSRVSFFTSMTFSQRTALIIASIILPVSAIATAVIALFPYEPTQPPIVDESGSTAQGVREVVAGNNAFAFDVYRQMNDAANMFFSPYSILSALAMVYEGARGTTAEEMRAVLHMPDHNTLRANFAKLYNQINAKEAIRTGNALWAQKEFSLVDAYVDVVARYYGGKAAQVDFMREGEQARQTINAFIAQQTDQRIPELLTEDDLDLSTRLVLTNAVSFQEKWKWTFNSENTVPGKFKTTSGDKVDVEYMTLFPEDDQDFRYASSDDLEILELPYASGEMAMTIVLPRGEFDTVLGDMDAEQFQTMQSAMKKTAFSFISLPRFSFHTSTYIEEALQALGMRQVFSEEADLSGMSVPEQLVLDSVIHQAAIDVNEEGTEAAAATAATVKVLGTEPGTVKKAMFKADRPFLFVIQDKTTDAIVFMGKVSDPTKE